MDVALSGTFCIGKCNRQGITVQVDDTIITGITPANFYKFFNDYILNNASAERKGRSNG